MIKRVYFTGDAFNESKPPYGFKIVGYSGSTFSEQIGSSVSSIGGTGSDINIVDNLWGFYLPLTQTYSIYRIGLLGVPVGDYSISFNGSPNGDYTHSEEYEWHGNQSNSGNSHAEGNGVYVYGYNSHGDGSSNTIASGGITSSSHVEGQEVYISGKRSHGEGYQTDVTGSASHGEGFRTLSSGHNSHAEGRDTTSSGLNSHAQNKSRSSGLNSHSGGWGCTSSGAYSFTHGHRSSIQSSGTYSIALGGSYSLDDTNNVGYNTRPDSISGISPNTTYLTRLVMKLTAVPTSSSDPIGEEGSMAFDGVNYYWKSGGQWLKMEGLTF